MPSRNLLFWPSWSLHLNDSGARDTIESRFLEFPSLILGGYMQAINGKQLYYAFAAGGKSLIAEREVLNKMNVFPVPDGDTGTNLSFTLKTMIENTEISPDAGRTMQSLAESALIGARGNSGILFAQFVNGMAEKIGNVSQLTLEIFVDSANHAVTRAYQAISNPVEGSIRPGYQSSTGNRY